MWKIGNIEINGKVVLAPMAGFTSSGYRRFMKQFGVSLSYTEMVSDHGLIYENKETYTYLETKNDELPIGIQLFGADAENLLKAAKIVAKTAPFCSFLDINAGCPVPKVTKTGAGSALLKNPEVLADIVRTLKKEMNIPITVKIRLGWDNKHMNYMEVIKLLEESGVDAIAIHARTTKELYSGEPHYELLKDLRTKMNVPLIVSGNIFTLDDAIKALELTKADAVMVARGSLGNPFLIKQIDEYVKTGVRLPNPSLDQQINYCLELAKYMIDEKGEEKAMRIYRSIAPKFFTGFPNSKDVRRDLAQNMVSFEYLQNTLKKLK